jgi:hypothetical protein
MVEPELSVVVIAEVTTAEETDSAAGTGVRDPSYQTITVTDSSGVTQESVVASVEGNKGGASEY